MKPGLDKRLIRVASILEQTAALYEAAYPENDAQKRERVSDIKDFLIKKGWKPSALFGLRLFSGDDYVWLTFSLDLVAINSTVRNRYTLQFYSEPADPLADQIDATARQILSLKPEGNLQPKIDEKSRQVTDFDKKPPALTPAQQVSLGFKKLDWGVSVEDDVLLVQNEVPNSTTEAIVYLKYDTDSGRGVTLYSNNETKPTVLYPFELPHPRTTSLQDTFKELIKTAVAAMKRILSIEQEAVKQKQVDTEQQKKDLAYEKFKARMKERLEEERLEQEMAERFKKENPDVPDHILTRKKPLTKKVPTTNPPAAPKRTRKPKTEPVP